MGSKSLLGIWKFRMENNMGYLTYYYLQVITPTTLSLDNFKGVIALTFLHYNSAHV